jgi:hypothetical protein
VVLNFSALAYPLPIECVWQKFIDNKWENISAITNIIIYCSGLTSSLTINSTREENFGHYRLNISNPIGSVVQDFFISTEGKQFYNIMMFILSKLEQGIGRYQFH